MAATSANPVVALAQAAGSPTLVPRMEADAHSSPAVALAAWHSLCWLVFANVVGVLLAGLLLAPGINSVLGEWTYGRWMPVHINLQLYGWCSLPLVAFLFHAYDVDGAAANWSRPVLWMWSTALAVATMSWLSGHTSGKLFLDWTGYSRVLFPSALFMLWLLLACSFRRHWHQASNSSYLIRAVKLSGLCLLLAVPVLIYIASSPAIYPPINPDSGGPTGASQLESVLVIVAILLLIPHGMVQRTQRRTWVLSAAWTTFVLEGMLCLGLGRADVSHHQPIQFLALASLLVWIALVPAYYREFEWHPATRRWRSATLIWWAVLVPTGWCLFLPGVLEHFKFTDGLVGHSLLAMAGFASSLLILILVQLLGDDGWIFNSDPWFYMWQLSVGAYVLLMFAAGWMEGSDPSFTIVPGHLREIIYGMRLLLGVLMLIASAYWLVDASKLLRTHAAPSGQHA